MYFLFWTVLGSSADRVPRTCDFTSCCQDCCVDLTPRSGRYLESSFEQDILLINSAVLLGAVLLGAEMGFR